MGKFTAEEIKEIIKKWAEEKANQKELVFDDLFCDGTVVRYKTGEMTKVIPNNPDGKETGFHGKDKSKRTDHYAYEIVCQTDILNLRLAFNYTNMSAETKRICESLLQEYKMMKKDDIAFTADSKPIGNFRRLCIFDIRIKECKEEYEIREAMDKLFYQMKGYETFIIFMLKEAKQSYHKEDNNPMVMLSATREDYMLYKEELKKKAKSDKKHWIHGELEFLSTIKVIADKNTISDQVRKINSKYSTHLSNEECDKLAAFIDQDSFRDRILTNDKDVAASLVMELAEAAKEIRGRSNLSFASKYCHHCNPNMYPIFDSINERYLKKHYSYIGKGDYRKYMDVYALFCKDIGVDLSSAEDPEEGFWVDKFINNLDKES